MYLCYKLTEIVRSIISIGNKLYNFDFRIIKNRLNIPIIFISGTKDINKPIQNSRVQKQLKKI